MTLHKLCVGSLLLVLGGLCTAQQVEIKIVPVKNIDRTSGEKMYAGYCAVCHGTDGKGAGPAAKALKTAPADLTALAKRNNGKFPTNRVYSTIVGDTATRLHNDKDMPVWGSLFLKFYETPTTQSDVALRATNLTRYVKSLQQ